MSYYKVKGQARFLENHLRGTGRTLTASQAAARYGIKNLTARVFDLRQLGLNVKVDGGKYTMTARDTSGSRAKILA
jgi:Fic family protein